MTIKQKIHPDSKKSVFDVYVSARSNTIKGIRVQRRKTNIKSLAQAKKVEQELLRSCCEKVINLERRGGLWHDIVEKWIRYRRADTFEPISKQTIDDYEQALKKWTRCIWIKPAKEINRSDIRNIIHSLDKDGRSKSFQVKIKNLINSVYIWGIEENLIEGVNQSPTFGVRVTRKRERVPTILNIKEIKKLLRVASNLNHEWFPIWAVALYTGCRNGELFALTWDDVNLENNLIRVSKSFNRRTNTTKDTKAGYWRNVPINEELRKILLNLKKLHPESNFVLPRLREWRLGNQAKELKKFCLGYEITPVRFHDLRACFATQLLQNKISPATVMKICGWRDLDTMARYIRLAGIDESGATNSLTY